MRVQVSQDGFILNGTHQLLVYADDVNILAGSVHTTKKHTGTLAAATKETGLEVNADKTKYMIISRDQNAGRSHNIKIDTSSFESAEQSNYLGTILTHQISTQEKNEEQAEVREHLLSFGAEYFVFQFAA